MANIPRSISKAICDNAINLNGVGSQNDSVHNNRVMTRLGMQVSLEAIYNNQMGDQDVAQLGDGLVQIDAMECCLHGPGHGTLKILKTAGDQGLIVSLHNRHIDEKVALKCRSSNLQVLERAFNADRLFDE